MWDIGKIGETSMATSVRATLLHAVAQTLLFWPVATTSVLVAAGVHFTADTPNAQSTSHMVSVKTLSVVNDLHRLNGACLVEGG